MRDPHAKEEHRDQRPATLDRRRFLSGATLGALAASTGLGCSGPVPAQPEVSPAREPAASPAPAGDRWATVRDQFALTRDYIYMVAMLLASHPAPVRAAIEAHRRGFDDNPALYFHENVTRYEKAMRESAARHMGVRPDQLALTDSTTMGLGVMYGGFSLQPGDDVLATEHDHYSTIESLRLAAERSGATFRRARLYDEGRDASADRVVDAIARAVRPETRLVAVTWVHSSTGVKLPVAAIAKRLKEMAAARGKPLLLFVDGVHGFGIEDVNIPDLGCDAFIAGCHKWLFGPRGTGVVWANDAAWAAVRPIIPAFGPTIGKLWREGKPNSTAPKPEQMTPGGFHSFEHRWALSAAFDFHFGLGKADVQARTHALATQVKEGLARMPHVTLHTPASPALSSGIVCFEVRGMTPEQTVSALLAKKVVASTTPYQTSYARLTPAILNTPEEVEVVLGHVRAMG